MGVGRHDGSDCQEEGASDMDDMDDMDDLELRGDPFAHLKQRASERAERTVERMRAGIAALRAAGRKVTAESLKLVTRDLEPGFAGLSFQVIRRNPRAYELYREAADAFNAPPIPNTKARRRRRRRTRGAGKTQRASYDPLQRLDKRDLVQRIRTPEEELESERQRRGALANDQQTLLAQILRLDTEIVLMQAERSRRE
jgi:hypothetical protein